MSNLDIKIYIRIQIQPLWNRFKTHLDVEVIARFDHFYDCVVLLFHGLRRVQAWLVWEGDQEVVDPTPGSAHHAWENTSWQLALEIDDILQSSMSTWSSIT